MKCDSGTSRDSTYVNIENTRPCSVTLLPFSAVCRESHLLDGRGSFNYSHLREAGALYRSLCMHSRQRPGNVSGRPSSPLP